MPPHDLRGKTCAFLAHIFDDVEKMLRCGRPAAGFDKAAREYRCTTHLNRKPHVKRQEPGARTRTRRPTYTDDLPPIHRHTD